MQLLTQDNGSNYQLTSLSKYSSKVVRLSEAAKRLNISANHLLKIFGQYDCCIPDKAGSFLTYDHVWILADHFRKIIEHDLKQVCNQFHSLNELERVKYQSLFGQFISLSENCDLSQLFEREIDFELVHQRILSLLITKPQEVKLIEWICIKIRKFKYDLRRLSYQIRIRKPIFLVSHHYHIFPVEEPYSENATLFICFSEWVIKTFGKASIRFNLVNPFNYGKKYSNFKRTYTTMQFI
jgi:hypothetical protein